MFKLDEHQQKAVDAIVYGQDKITCISGSAGRGKSTIVLTAVKALIKSGINNDDIFFCGPTGKCCRVLNEMLDDSIFNRPETIHKMLGCRGYEWEYNHDNRFQCKYLFIEEMSMVGSLLLARVLSSISEDARIVLSGDPKQLPSVESGAPFTDIINSGKNSYELITNYRQKNGSMIGRACESIINGKRLDFSPIDGQNTDMVFSEVEDKEEIPNIVAEIIRPWVKERIDYVCIIPQRTGTVGITAMNDFLQEKINPYREGVPQYKIYDFYIREGDRVRVTKNSYQLNIQNGLVGWCIAVGESGIVCDFDGQIVTFEEKKDIDNLILSYSQTAHSVQGGEYDNVCFICDKSHTYMMTRELLYVGVSRARKFLHIVGQKQTISRAIRKKMEGQRDTFLGEKLDV